MNTVAILDVPWVMQQVPSQGFTMVVMTSPLLYDRSFRGIGHLEFLTMLQMLEIGSFWHAGVVDVKNFVRFCNCCLWRLTGGGSLVHFVISSVIGLLTTYCIFTMLRLDLYCVAKSIFGCFFMIIYLLLVLCVYQRYKSVLPWGHHRLMCRFWSRNHYVEWSHVFQQWEAATGSLGLENFAPSHASVLLRQ